MRWRFSQKLRNLNMGAVTYTTKKLRGFFFEVTDLIICKTMRRWRMPNGKPSVEYLAHQAQFLPCLQGGEQKPVNKKDGQRTEVLRRRNKEPKCRSEQRQIMTI